LALLKAPDFEISLDQKERTRLSDLIGARVIVLDFWASWFGPCIKEMPELKRIRLEKEVEIIGISIDDRKEPWLKSLDKLGLPWTNIWDGDKSIKELYEVSSVPAKFVINKNGVITSKNPKDLALEIDKAYD
jgi:peroxiredoxin